MSRFDAQFFETNQLNLLPAQREICKNLYNTLKSYKIYCYTTTTPISPYLDGARQLFGIASGHLTMATPDFLKYFASTCERNTHKTIPTDDVAYATVPIVNPAQPEESVEVNSRTSKTEIIVITEEDLGFDRRTYAKHVQNFLNMCKDTRDPQKCETTLTTLKREFLVAVGPILGLTAGEALFPTFKNMIASPWIINLSKMTAEECKASMKYLDEQSHPKSITEAKTHAPAFFKELAIRQEKTIQKNENTTKPTP